MESLSVLEGHHLIDLMSLKIEDCPNFEAFPAPNLIRLGINKCQHLNSMPTNMHRLLPSIQHLEIRNCPQLKSFPKGGLPSNLVLFRIDVSEKLFASRMDWGLKRLHSFTTLILSNLASDFWVVESFPEENLLPTSLTTLFIGGFLNLRSLDNKGLQHLTSLQQLWIETVPSWSTCQKWGCLSLFITYGSIHVLLSVNNAKRRRVKSGARLLTSPSFPLMTMLLYEPKVM